MGKWGRKKRFGQLMIRYKFDTRKAVSARILTFPILKQRRWKLQAASVKSYSVTSFTKKNSLSGNFLSNCTRFTFRLKRLTNRLAII